MLLPSYNSPRFILSPRSTFVLSFERFIFLSESTFLHELNRICDGICRMSSFHSIRFFPRSREKVNFISVTSWPGMNDWWPCVILHNAIITQSSVNKIIEHEIVFFSPFKVKKIQTHKVSWSETNSIQKEKNGKRINLTPKLNEMKINQWTVDGVSFVDTKIKSIAN